MARYQTYTVGERKVIVVSRYAGRVVRGVAKCSPGDTYDLEKGEKLARLRCDAKISEKRVARSQEAYADALKNLAAAQKRVAAMQEYMNDAAAEQVEVLTELAKLEAEL